MEDEVWKPVVGWQGLYEVSNLGGFRRVAPSCGPYKKVRTPSNRTYTSHKGYSVVSLSDKSRGRTRKKVPLHTVVCEAFHGPRPSPIHQVAHNDGTKKNNHASNLRWVLPKENCKDRTKHGTAYRGENHAWSKVALGDVLMILELNKLGFPRTSLAKAWRVARPTVDAICRGRSWSNSVKAFHAQVHADGV